MAKESGKKSEKLEEKLCEFYDPRSVEWGDCLVFSEYKKEKIGPRVCNYEPKYPGCKKCPRYINYIETKQN